MKEAIFYEVDHGEIRCYLCNNHCVIENDKRGLCGARESRDGKLYSLVYGICVADHVDPIEKKPLFHFYPGTKAYSLGTVGCNFRCLNCQNWQISQMPKGKDGAIIGEDLLPEVIIAKTKETGERERAEYRESRLQRAVSCLFDRE